MTTLATVPSLTSPGKVYEIRLGKDGRTYCTCKAWQYGRGKPCKHLRALAERPQSMLSWLVTRNLAQKAA
jgi:hypothetical protein